MKVKALYKAHLIRGPASTIELSLVDKIELGRAYQNVTGTLLIIILLDCPDNLLSMKNE